MKYLVLILSVLAIQCQSQQTMKLIYVGDPMCSWCYGLAPELEQVLEESKPKFDIEFIMGGLRPFYNKPMSEMKTFLTKHWQDVNKATNQPFSYDILDRSDLNYDTEPPCRAVVTVREIKPVVVPEFFNKVQQLFYKENKDMNASTTYHEIIKSLDIDTARFDDMFLSIEMKNLVKQDFSRARELQATSFPTILLEINNEQFVVANGYMDSKTILSRMQTIVDKHQ